MKKKSLPVTNLGTISLIMIFIVLCMVTFAALSLSSASRDMRAGQNMRAHLEEYYNVSNEAETLLAQADHIFAEAYAATADDSEFYRIVSEQTSPFAKAENADGQFTLTYQLDINDTQALLVKLAVRYPQQVKKEDADSFYKILSWQVVHTDTWEGDNTIKLIQ